ncbi:FAD-binding domain-containing protein [Bimuria novae-zelandiae CBS 107.79]|uniref:FAD-binding domain-containing protein n=1 Tax=Bimuria novae-zelandiae CBS 107.79 TaxID=1447943 RepID=A0A6A5UHZ5_9PLEO|nr:FAD-binding domain-containing protein [Bimuria novae-zelandiae CBS 107.79]
MGDSTPAPLDDVVLKLKREFGTAVLQPGESAYEEENGRFWNRDNSDVRPKAILTPSSSQDAASIIHTLSSTKTPFAIRSGGYMPTPSYNTSPSILLSLRRFSSIELLQGDRVRFGTGCQWGSVYDVLEPHGLVVPGGRSRHVGVGGFLLHGGISHFYGATGWACESILAFEVVLPDGRVVEASQGREEELFWALKGGGKNFGCVTAFTMQCQRLGKIWGGSRVALGTPGVAVQVFDATHGLLGEEVDEKAHVEVISFYNPYACPGGDPMFSLSLAYAGEVEKPEGLKAFLEVEAVADTTRPTSQRELADDEKNFIGFDKRALFRGFSYRGSPELTLDVYNAFYAAAKASGMFELEPSALAAVLWSPINRKMAARTSAVSLGEDAEPYLLFCMNFRWENPEVSTKMHSIANRIADELKQKLRDADAFIPYTYGNIAGVDDVTYAGLPEKTRQRLREVAAKYDPQGVFQKQVAGFKLE